MRLIKCKIIMNFDYEAYSDIYINCITCNLYLSIVRLIKINQEGIIIIIIELHDSTILG